MPAATDINEDTVTRALTRYIARLKPREIAGQPRSVSECPLAIAITLDSGLSVQVHRGRWRELVVRSDAWSRPVKLRSPRLYWFTLIVDAVSLEAGEPLTRADVEHIWDVAASLAQYDTALAEIRDNLRRGQVVAAIKSLSRRLAVMRVLDLPEENHD